MDLVSVPGRLDELLVERGLERLQTVDNKQFICYLSLILRWNARLNLTAIRDVEAILSRHFVECIACARGLPSEIATLLDFGSGAGFPGIPIAICRPEIAVTLAESQGKKSAFLREAVRTLNLSAAVYSGRAESLTQEFDCVAMRAVDKMEDAVAAAAKLVRTDGWLTVMTTEAETDRVGVIAGPSFHWREPVHLPGSDQRVMALGRRTA